MFYIFKWKCVKVRVVRLSCVWVLLASEAKSLSQYSILVSTWIDQGR